MLSSSIRTGLAAGLLAGLLAGAFGLLVGSPSLEHAIALEEAAAHGHAHDEELPRWLQQAGLVAGSGLVGAAVGALFGLAFAWSVGRLLGDAWTRSLKLGAGGLGAFVLMPALVQPPNPPGVGDPETVAARTVAYLGSIVAGLLLAAAAWTAGRWLQERTGLRVPARQALLGAAVVATGLAFVALVAGPAGSAPVPAELLWSFRLAAVATQAVLYGGLAVVFGLLSADAERPATLAPR
jgi:hypothetical protein